MQQLYYELDLSAIQCFFVVKINDVELAGLNVEGQMRTDIPINQLVLESGNQEIEVNALPLLGQNFLHSEASVRYRVNVYDVSSGDYVYVKQLEDIYTPSVQENTPIGIHKSFFQAEVPYILNAWQNSVNLRNENHIKDMLIQSYQNLITQINNKQFREFANQYSIKEQNNTTALYLSPDEAKNRLQRLIHDFENGFIANPIDENVNVTFSAHGTLASLKTRDGMPALSFTNLDTDEDLFLPVTFHQPHAAAELVLI